MSASSRELDITAITAIIPGAEINQDGTTSIKGLRANMTKTPLHFVKLAESNVVKGKAAQLRGETTVSYYFDKEGTLRCNLDNIDTELLLKVVKRFGYSSSAAFVQTMKDETGDRVTVSIIGAAFMDYMWPHNLSYLKE
jgi:hypothetical protein